MNSNMFSPEMMSQMKNMMNPQMMKNAADSFSKMSDDQIRAYLTACGMGNVSPQMFRQMSGNLKNMDDKDLEKIKNSDQLNRGMNQQNFSPNSNPSNSNQPTDSKANKTNNNLNYTLSQKKTIVEKLEETKNLGNEYFRKNSYKEACEKYYEVLNELEYISDSDKINYKKQIDDLETICRINIANSKMKIEEYDIAINECLKVLKKTENFKAHFRAAVSFFKKSNFERARHHFLKARQVNPVDEKQQIENYINECNKFLDIKESVKKPEDVKERLIQDNNYENIPKKIQDTSDMSNKDNNKIENEKSQMKNISSNTNETKNPEIEKKNENISKSTKLGKLKEIIDDDSVVENMSEQEKKKDEILIEDEKPQKILEGNL
jgi:tetratricopeptide (TPR) repeat protein